MHESELAYHASVPHVFSEISVYRRNVDLPKVFGNGHRNK